jgi:hypothetical protein
MSYYFSVIPVFFPCACGFTGVSCQTKRDSLHDRAYLFSRIMSSPLGPYTRHFPQNTMQERVLHPCFQYSVNSAIKYHSFLGENPTIIPDSLPCLWECKFTQSYFGLKKCFISRYYNKLLSCTLRKTLEL